MDKTIEYYNQSAKSFVADTVDANVNELHSIFLSRLPTGAYIMDLGCGSGRDSKAFLEKGYRVLSVDGSEELCKVASRLTGQEVLCQTFENIHFSQKFDGIWACASILHVPSDRLLLVIGNISRALKPGGYFYVSFKYGTFEGERNGRYFTDMDEERFAKLIAPFPELEIVETRITGDVRPRRESETWLNVVVRKNPNS